MRIERSSMLEVLQQEYVKKARAYGVAEGKIVRKHAFRTPNCRSSRSSGFSLPPRSAGRC
nr:hypothetical protein [Haladaptatus sp. R4]